MKRCLFILLLSFVFSLPVYSADEDISKSTDLWDNWNDAPGFFSKKNKPAVSDEDFDKAIDTLKNTNRFGFKKKNKNIPKGEERNSYEESEVFEEHEEGNVNNTLPVVCIPVELSIGEGVLPVGHYQIQGEKDENGNLTLKLYQAQYVMAQLPAIETYEDFDEDTITFAKWTPEGDDKIKIIYGSLDFNAYAYVNINQ